MKEYVTRCSAVVAHWSSTAQRSEIHLISVSRYLHMNVESVGEGQDVGVRSVCHLFWLINPELQSRFDQDIIVISGELLEEKKMAIKSIFHLVFCMFCLFFLANGLSYA